MENDTTSEELKEAYKLAKVDRSSFHGKRKLRADSWLNMKVEQARKAKLHLLRRA